MQNCDLYQEGNSGNRREEKCESKFAKEQVADPDVRRMNLESNDVAELKTQKY